jgi:hypothetical protein
LKLNECSKIVRKLAFEKAIAVDENKSCVADSIDLDSIGKLKFLMKNKDERLD